MTYAIKKIEGFDLHEVDTDGRVFSSVRGRRIQLKPRNNGSNYLRVTLIKDGAEKQCLVHRLVASHFLPNPGSLATVNHIDGDKSNNAVDNLEWMSLRDNIDHAYRTGLAHGRPRSVVSDKTIRRLRHDFIHGMTRNKISVKYGLSLRIIERYVNARLFYVDSPIAKAVCSEYAGRYGDISRISKKYALSRAKIRKMLDNCNH